VLPKSWDLNLMFDDLFSNKKYEHGNLFW
jgi:hypothetical protein